MSRAGAQRAASQAGRILLVEDDPISRKLMRDALRAGGHETVEAVNGADGLAQATARPFDLIVLDIGLPELDGVEVTRRLRRVPATQRTPILAVTAYVMPGDEDRIRAAGCDAYLSKPLRFADFLDVVQQLLGTAAG